MKFRFEFDIRRMPWPFNHQGLIMLIGSCFTENIGEKFRRYKFQAEENPHGILFNPASVARALSDYISAAHYDASSLFFLNEGWHSWNHHSRFSDPDRDIAVKKINNSIAAAHDFLKTSSHLVITLGSAWVYQLTSEAALFEEGRVVSNNHKAPAAWFSRRLMGSAEIVKLYQRVLEELLAFNPGLKIVFTISPVRHLREGVVDNNRSKAMLIQAVHELVERFDQTYYFPAYELVLDDLRDYRFYAEDLVHPNYFATEYVWERLTEACMTRETRDLIAEIQKINLAYQHKPFNPDSGQHQAFRAATLEKIQALQEKHPFLNLGKEVAFFSGEGV